MTEPEKTQKHCTKLPDRTSHLLFWPIMIAGIAADLWTKYAIFKWLGPKQPYNFPVINGFFHLVLAENSGAAFGIAAGQRTILITVSIAALLVILTLFFLSGKEHKLTHIALAMFAAGICGNLYDRIFNYGRVRDFIDIVYWPEKHWPAFNIADSLLCIAVAIMIIATTATDLHDRKHAQQHK